MFGVFALVLVGVAAMSAARAAGRPFPSFLVDPSGVFSVAYLPTWAAPSAQLAYPDRVVAVEGQPLAQERGSFHGLGHTLQERVAELYDAGRRHVSISFERSGARLEVQTELRTFGLDELWLFFGVYVLMGLYILSSGAAVLVTAGRRRGAGAYLLLSVSGFAFLACFFDYHSTRWLAPLFSVSTVLIVVSLLWLALTFPVPVRMSPRIRLAKHAAVVGAALVAAWLAVGPALGHDVSALRLAVTVATPAALLVLAGAIVVRLRFAKGRARRELRSALLGLGVVPAAVAVAYVIAIPTNMAFFHILLPFAALAIPASVGFALVRHNILRSTLVLSRRVVMLPVAFVAVLGGAFVWWAAQQETGPASVLPIGTAALASLFLYSLGKRAMDRLFFGAAGRFRPTIEELSDGLTSLHRAREIRETLQTLVSRWLATGPVLVVDSADIAKTPRLPDGAVAALETGAHVWTEDDPVERSLVVPMRSLGELRGALVVAPSEAAPLYTSEDLALLDTIASLGAIALHHAQVIHELDELRQLEASARREDKRLTIGSLGAELSHEVAYPLNFFRHLLGRLSAGRAIDAEDIDVGREELERLTRMLASLRRLALPAPTCREIDVAGSVQRAVTLLRPEAGEKGVDLRVEVSEDLVVYADADQLLQLVANVLRNAIQAVDAGGSVRIDSRRLERGAVLEIRDNGPGLPEELGEQVFSPWVSTRAGGTGLGLAVAARVVRSFGWSMEVRRADGWTCFRIEMTQASLPRAHGR